MQPSQPWALLYTECDSFGDKLRRTLDQYGVAVVFEVEDISFCAEVLRDVFAFKKYVGNTTPSQIHAKGTGFPEKPRGVFFNCVSNLPTLWRVRCSSRVRRVFAEALQVKTSELVPSGDRIGLRLPTSPFGLEGGKGQVGGCTLEKLKNFNWNSKTGSQIPAHLDELQNVGTRDEPTDKRPQYQGTFSVLDSKEFVASPGSHKLYKRLVGELEKAAKGAQQWGYRELVKEQHVPGVQTLVETTLQAQQSSSTSDHCRLWWQVPIVAPRGAVVVWDARTVHGVLCQVECTKCAIMICLVCEMCVCVRVVQTKEEAESFQPEALDEALANSFTSLG